MTCLLIFADISIFTAEIIFFCYIKKYIYRLHFGTKFLILFNFSWVLKNYVINLFIILMTSAKTATLGFLKVTIFWIKVYHVIIYVNDVTSKIVSSDSNYIVDVFIWLKFDNSNFQWEKLSQVNFIRICQEKLLFLKGSLDSSLIIWDWRYTQT